MCSEHHDKDSKSLRMSLIQAFREWLATYLGKNDRLVGTARTKDVRAIILNFHVEVKQVQMGNGQCFS